MRGASFGRASRFVNARRLFEHDLFRNPFPTFRDHAPTSARVVKASTKNSSSGRPAARKSRLAAAVIAGGPQT